MESLIRDCGLAVQREQGVGDGTRAADLLVPRWDSDGAAAIDVTIRCPVQPSDPVRNVKDLPKWRKDQEDEKNKKYADPCARAGWSFFPFLLDTWGGLGPTARQFMSSLVKRAARARLGRERREFEQQLWQRLILPPMAQLGRQLALLLTLPQDGHGRSDQHCPYSVQ